MKPTASPWRRSRRPGRNCLRSQDASWLGKSEVESMDFRWFPMWFFYDFSMIFLWFSMVFYDFFLGFSVICYGFPMILSWHMVDFMGSVPVFCSPNTTHPVSGAHGELTPQYFGSGSAKMETCGEITCLGTSIRGSSSATGWWFGCHFLFSHILGIIIPID